MHWIFFFFKYLKSEFNSGQTCRVWLRSHSSKDCNSYVVFWILPKCLMGLTKKGLTKNFPYGICTKPVSCRRQDRFFGERGKLLPFHCSFHIFVGQVLVGRSCLSWDGCWRSAYWIMFWEAACAIGLTWKVCVGRMSQLSGYCGRSRCALQCWCSTCSFSWGISDLDIVRSKKLVYCNSRRNIKNL